MFAKQLMQPELWDRMFENHWHLVCHRSELERSGDYVRFTILDREIAIFNDGSSIIAFDNRCPHRGARIFDGHAGRQQFLCRYHGWSFRKGKLYGPKQQEFAGCDPAELDLNRLPIEWLEDFLFVSPAPSIGLSDQLGEVAPILSAISRSIFDRADFNAYEFLSDWRIGLENALEPYHVGVVHPTSLGTLQLQPGRNDYHGINSVWSSPVGEARTEKRLRSLTRMFDLTYQYEGYQSIYMFPFTMLSSTFGFSYSLQQFYPSITSDRTHFTSRLFRSRLKEAVKPELLAAFFDSSAELNRQTFEEDHQICQRVFTDSWSKDPPRCWSSSEEKLLHFRRCYSAFADGITAP